MKNQIHNGTSMTSKSIAFQMSLASIGYSIGVNEPYRQSNFYCGITCNIRDNYTRHKNDEFEGKNFEYICIYKCKTSKIAAKVEQLLKHKGFDCGDTNTFGNGGNEESKYVYIFRKP